MLQIDALSDSPNQVRRSPFATFNNNPISFVDPDGMESQWIEDPDDKNKWIAEKGDGAETLAQDAGISREEAYQTMDAQGHGTYKDKNDGVTKSAIDPGQKIDISSAECMQVDVEAKGIIKFQQEVKSLKTEVKSAKTKFKKDSFTHAKLRNDYERAAYQSGTEILLEGAAGALGGMEVGTVGPARKQKQRSKKTLDSLKKILSDKIKKSKN